ncbi:MAG: AarF/ABC1/UbiB kinase family protein [Pseudomonadota bacterium]
MPAQRIQAERGGPVVSAERVGRAVPAGRIARLARLGGVATGVAAGVAGRGIGQLARGHRPRLQDLVLTPGNLARFADELGRMRGAAMKMGQLLSMDAGDLLPKELADILARLRADADPMPPKQLRRVLDEAWGTGWLKRFRRFDVRPIAAASIGQVHKAELKDGRRLAIKVQYPGVRRSIDSDVSNVGALIRWSGLLPQGTDIEPLLAEARRQLHEEADYAREAEQVAAFSRLLAGDPDFAVPAPELSLTTENVLAMDFVPGGPIEAQADAPQAVRDRIGRLLLGLLLREVFDFGLVQTDPNFANYRYDADSARVVLLDFGAARAYAPERVTPFRTMLRGCLTDDRAAMREAATSLGYIGPETAERHAEQVLALIDLVASRFRTGGEIDFASDDTAARLRDAGMALGADDGYADVPAMDTLYMQRKVAGMYLLVSRLKARVDVRSLAEAYL